MSWSPMDDIDPLREDFWEVYKVKETVCTLVLAVWDILESLLSKKEFNGCLVEVEMNIVGFRRLCARHEVRDAVRLLKPFELSIVIRLLKLTSIFPSHNL